MTTSAAFRKIQIGREATPHGTPVAATRVIYGELSVTPQPTYYQPDNEGRFSLARRHQMEVINQASALSYSGALDYRSLHHVCAMCFRGNISPSGGGDDKTWNFIFRTTDTNAPDTYSWQYGTNIQGYRVANAFPTSLGLAFNMTDAAMASMDLMGNLIELNAFTSLDPANFERIFIPSQKLQVYIDDVVANLGNTEFPGNIVSVSLDPELGLEVARYAKGSVNPSAYAEAPRVGTLQLVMAFDANAKAEFDNFLAGTDRFVRLYVDSGVEIGSTGNNFELTIDCRVKWTEGPEMFGVEYNQHTLPLTGELYPFAASGDDRLLDITLVNDAASLAS